MSRWTQINGVLELDGNSYKTIDGKRYIPFPKSQFRFDFRHNANEKDKAEVTMDIYSLPSCRDSVREAMKKMPSGEHNCIGYYVNQSSHDICSGSTVLTDYEKEAINEYGLEIIKRGANKNRDLTLDKVKILWVNNFDTFTLTLKDSIRWCSGAEIASCLEDAIKYLCQEKIIINDGYVEWRDEWESNHLYTLRAGNALRFSVWNTDTHEELAYKIIDVNYDYSKIDNDDFVTLKITKSENWSDYCGEKYEA